MNTKLDFASLLFTKDWQSYAYLQAGVDWRLRGDDQWARQMFLQALRRDRKNRAALLNLGILDTEAGRYEWALRTLERAREAAEHVNDYEQGPIWYKATYQIAATFTYKGDLANADSESKKLIEKTLTTLRELAPSKEPASQEPSTQESTSQASTSQEPTVQESASSGEGSTPLQQFLRSIRQLTEILRAGIWVGQGKLQVARDKVSVIQQNEDLPYRARYNLGCFYSRLSAKEPSKLGKRNAYEKALENLQYAFEEDGTLTKWASNDPALKWLREDDKTKLRDGKSANEAFDELRALYAPPGKAKSAEGLPLAGIIIIGETYAKLLKERGIGTEDDLVLEAAAATAQKNLADGLGIDVNLVRRWALLADLMRIVGIDAQRANLLEAARIGSLSSLKDRDAEDLVGLLRQVNRARSLVSEAPSVETVRSWIEEAKGTIPKVSDVHQSGRSDVRQPTQGDVTQGWWQWLPFYETVYLWWRRRRDRRS